MYDGSEHEVGNGYYLCKIVAADIESTRVIPLYCKAYAYDAVKSENRELLHAIGIVESHIGDKAVHAIDRGGDRGVIKKIYFKVALKYVSTLCLSISRASLIQPQFTEYEAV